MEYGRDPSAVPQLSGYRQTLLPQCLGPLEVTPMARHDREGVQRVRKGPGVFRLSGRYQALFEQGRRPLVVALIRGCPPQIYAGEGDPRLVLQLPVERQSLSAGDLRQLVVALPDGQGSQLPERPSPRVG